MRPLLLVLLSAMASSAQAADLQAKTVAAFDRYVQATERRMADAAQPFLRVDAMPEAPRKTALAALRKGEFVIDSLTTLDAGHKIDVPDGLIHHWVGVVFVPGATVDQAVSLLQDYGRHGEIYQPNVARSKLIERDGDRFKVYLRFYMKKVLTAVVNSEHEARFTRDGPDRASSRIYSTRIAQVDEPGTPKEREMPEGRDDGYLWRLNSYWRFVGRDKGVYVQCESITLSRDFPPLTGWFLKPFTLSIPRDTLSFTLDTTRKELQARTGAK